MDAIQSVGMKQTSHSPDAMPFEANSASSNSGSSNGTRSSVRLDPTWDTKASHCARIAVSKGGYLRTAMRKSWPRECEIGFIQLLYRVKIPGGDEPCARRCEGQAGGS